NASATRRMRCMMPRSSRLSVASAKKRSSSNPAHTVVVSFANLRMRARSKISLRAVVCCSVTDHLSLRDPTIAAPPVSICQEDAYFAPLSKDRPAHALGQLLKRERAEQRVAVFIECRRPDRDRGDARGDGQNTSADAAFCGQ